jgi:hypothetical protein
MPRFSLRADGRYDEQVDTLIDLPDLAAAERAAIQMLAELRINAPGGVADSIARVAVHDVRGRPVLDVILSVSRPALS